MTLFRLRVDLLMAEASEQDKHEKSFIIVFFMYSQDWVCQPVKWCLLVFFGCFVVVCFFPYHSSFLLLLLLLVLMCIYIYQLSGFEYFYLVWYCCLCHQIPPHLRFLIFIDLKTRSKEVQVLRKEVQVLSRLDDEGTWCEEKQSLLD